MCAGPATSLAWKLPIFQRKWRLVPFSCRGRRRKRRGERGGEREREKKRGEIRSVTEKGLYRPAAVGEIEGQERERRRAGGKRARVRVHVRGVAARAKGNGGTIPVRLSVVRTSVVLLQSRICAFYAGMYISARRRRSTLTDQHTRNTPTDPGCEPRNQGGGVEEKRVGPEWKRRSAMPKGADACSGLGGSIIVRNGNDVLIDPPIFYWPGRLCSR